MDRARNLDRLSDSLRPRHHRRRRHRPRRRGGGGGARLPDGAPRGPGLRPGHVQPLHQAGARRGAVPRAGERRAGARGAARAWPAPAERAAPGGGPRVRRARLRVVVRSLLRGGAQAVRRARRASPAGEEPAPLPGAGAGAHPHARARPAQRWGALLRRAVRRRAAGGDARPDRGRPRGGAGEPRRRGRTDEERRKGPRGPRPRRGVGTRARGPGRRGRQRDRRLRGPGAADGRARAPRRWSLRRRESIWSCPTRSCPERTP